MRFFEELKRAGESIWKRIYAHPFVQGIGDGSLPVEAFRFYMCQDYVFLVEYARVLALAASKGEDPATMGKLAGLLDATLNREMNLHRAYAARFGVTHADLESVELAPTARAYTRQLLEVAHAGTLAEIAGSLLPCQWGYAEIGARLAREGDVSEANPYAEWIQAYASAEFRDLADWLAATLDRLAEGSPPSLKRRIENLFLISSRYEFLFWEMAYRQERWPV